MHFEEGTTDGFCLPIFIDSDRISLLSYSYMTMTYNFPRLDLCGKAPVRSLKPLLLVLNGMVAVHISINLASVHCYYDKYRGMKFLTLSRG